MFDTTLDSSVIEAVPAVRPPGPDVPGAILAHSPHPVLCFDARGQLQYANPAAARVQRAFRESTAALWQALCDTAEWLQVQPAGEPAVLEADGHCWQVTSATVPNEGLVLFYLTDVTAWRTTEQQLRHQQEFRQLMLDTSSALFTVYDTADRPVFYNRAVRELLQHLQKYDGPAHLDPATPAYAERRRRVEINEQVRRTNGEVRQEMSLTLDSGEQRWYQTVRCPLHNPDGTVFVLGVGTDITDLKRSQQQAEASARAREAFLANISHEVRTPIHGMLGLAAQLGKTDLTDRQQHLLTSICAAGAHLTGLLNDVLDLSRLNSGAVELEAVPFELSASVEAVLGPLAAQAREKGLRFRGATAERPFPRFWVLGDPLRLNQILINLVSNALKFTPRGGIRVSCRVLAETDTDLRVRFRVADTGIGIAPGMLTSVFDDFTQANAGTSRQYGGAGLGLSISRNLARQMGGELTVRSRLGQGSCFTLELPLPKAPAGARPAPTEVPIAPERLAGLRVLLVDDNEMNREVTRLTLADWALVPTEAANGAEALQLLAEQDFDVVLLDIQMPGLNGLKAVQRLRALPHPARARTPVIAFTAAALPHNAGYYREQGIIGQLAKPFTEADLYRQLLALPRPARPYSLAGLQQFAKGNQTLVGQLVASFLNTAPTVLDRLGAAAAAGDWLTAARQVHHLQFNLHTLEVTGIEACAATLLQPLHHGPPDGPAPDPALLRAAALEFTTVVEGVVQALRRDAAAGPTSSESS
ncbi:PAS domain-containing hybrid sensor histidine kinase/response regulator [Hymenobacter convexus]|uniref:PAS domain-containing hybrid sensor histidine kinase/response regulator n=1 Tax=Hymenobacter sp. CA1UV-4 TaxID=3063782 RepID=UPI002712B89C|nr:PAS domain-containing hybrid sensor histidine kinase/response regulator [Hymenobacter sp. CA1UV-4]MDO7852507.1 ATP-binding protein [Hymenobacter sp. CA1UV-4]